MIDYSNSISASRAAIIAAVGMIIMVILAPIADAAIIKKLVILGDAAATFSNIVTAEGLFRLAVFFFLIVAILDIIIAWALYILLKPVNENVSLLAAWFRIIYAALLMSSLFYLLNAVQLAGGAAFYAPSEINQIQIQTLFLIRSFSQCWELGLIVFGFHLSLLGYLILKAGYMRKILGVLIIIASLGYLIDGFGKILLSNYNINIAVFTFIGEVILIFWLLIKGRKMQF
jgi:hypothetical protein